MEEVLKSCQNKPAVNMIMLHPNLLTQTRSLLDLMAKHKIVPGGYSSLKPLWDEEAGTEVRQVAKELSVRLACKPEDILLRWCASKK